MYAVGEYRENVGGTVSRDQCRYWLSGRKLGTLTPASDERAEFETAAQAQAALDAAPMGGLAVIEIIE